MGNVFREFFDTHKTRKHLRNVARAPLPGAHFYFTTFHPTILIISH